MNFGQDGVSSGKVGAAAIGQSGDDVWNFYSRDDEAGGFKSFGWLSNLKLADGTTTMAGLTVANAPGSWGNSSSDLMYANYLYPFDGLATITVTNLVAGAYDLYVYAHDGNYELTVGSTSYGIKTCRDHNPAGVSAWQEGRQYVRYSGINVASGEALTLTVRPGLDGYAVISGIQLVYAAAPPSSTQFLANVDFGGATSSARTGAAVVGQEENDFWNYYTRDDGAGGWRIFGLLSDLKLANGVVSSVGLAVANAPGAWATTSTDPMYANYIYPFNGDATFMVMNLPVGQYDFYLYGPDAKYRLESGGVDYGMRANVDDDPTGSPVWQEGVQYSRYSNVVVAESTRPVVITVQPGVHGYATLSGLQIIGGTPIQSTSQRSTGRLVAHRQSDQSIRLHFNADRVQRYRVQASIDLKHWLDLGYVMSDDNGNCEFEDRDSVRFSQRYYRIVSP
ncbi:MAG: hypothetical protein M9920_08705 [Verrucomicrobiae bacterium]|nr:hypothetical protein [Verrucomicrobiae bacterium]